MYNPRRTNETKMSVQLPVIWWKDMDFGTEETPLCGICKVICNPNEYCFKNGVPTADIICYSCDELWEYHYDDGDGDYYKKIKRVILWRKDMNFGTKEEPLCGICRIEVEAGGEFNEDGDLVDDVICLGCDESWCENKKDGYYRTLRYDSEIDLFVD